jgi:transposase-like protein
MAVWLSSTRRPLGAEILALRERLAMVQAENDLLRARLGRMEPHHRPRYAPWERLRILLHRARYGLSVESTARAFFVTDHTVMNWLREVRGDVSRLVRSRKPINALPDLVREISFFLRREWPRWGTRRIAGILARLGLQASRTSVQRILRRPPPRGIVSERRPSILRARHACQVWVADFTQVGGFFRSIVVGAVLDAFSRKVLAIRVWPSEPGAAGACLLLRDAIRHHGRPRWLVSDRGSSSRCWPGRASGGDSPPWERRTCRGSTDSGGQ